MSNPSYTCHVALNWQAQAAVSQSAERTKVKPSSIRVFFPLLKWFVIRLNKHIGYCAKTVCVPVIESQGEKKYSKITTGIITALHE